MPDRNYISSSLITFLERIMFWLEEPIILANHFLQDFCVQIAVYLLGHFNNFIDYSLYSRLIFQPAYCEPYEKHIPRAR